MKLLLDQNLSQRLVHSLRDLFAGSQHVRLLGLAEADDRVIWDHANAHDFVSLATVSSESTGKCLK